MLKLLTNILLYSFILIVWQIFSFKFLPGPIEIIEAFVLLLQNSTYWWDVYYSLLRFTTGVGFGLLLGALLGVTLGMFNSVKSVVFPIISLLYPIPKIALLPLFLIWFGFGEFPKMLLVFMGAFLPIIITTYSATVRIPESLVDASYVCGGSKFHTLKHVIFPYILPTIITNSRIAISIGLTLLVAAEMIGANAGIGQFILNSGSLLQLDQMFVGIFTLSFIALAFNYVVTYIENHFFEWKSH